MTLCLHTCTSTSASLSPSLPAVPTMHCFLTWAYSSVVEPDEVLPLKLSPDLKNSKEKPDPLDLFKTPSHRALLTNTNCVNSKIWLQHSQ